jgi:hypothetical protein
MQVKEKTLQSRLYDAQGERNEIANASAQALARLKEASAAVPRLENELGFLQDAHVKGLTEPRSQFSLEDEMRVFRAKANGVLEEFAQIEALISDLRPHLEALAK